MFFPLQKDRDSVLVDDTDEVGRIDQTTRRKIEFGVCSGRDVVVEGDTGWNRRSK